MKIKILLYRCLLHFLTILFTLTWPVVIKSTSAQAATFSLEKKLTIGFNQVPILSVFSKIETVSGLRFSYSLADLKEVDPVTLPEKNRNIIQLLTELSSKSGLKFNLSRGLVAVSSRPGFLLERKKPPILVRLKADTLVQGVVTDSLKRGLPGVSVFIKGKSNIGTSTDLNGRYSLQVPENSILVFKMVGFKTVEKPADKSIVNVLLLEDNSGLDEVQIVAFGTQRKESIVGAITTIKPGELKIPSSNLTAALQGRIAGIIAYQRSGEPGQDNADFFIRGAATFGYKKDPLILIDGLELTSTDLARLQPNDIASFSVLKDASSAAVYGARAANGVILVTTKRGSEGKTEINFQYDHAMSEPTKNLKLADPVTYMRLHNEAITTRDPLGNQIYSQNKIDGTIAGLDKLSYPATNWMDMLLKKQTFNSKANLSIKGGGKVATYYVTGTLNQDNGILKVDKRNNFNSNIDLKSTSIRSNVDVNITSSTQMAVRLYGNFDDYTGPINGGSAVYNQIMNSNPVLFAPYYPADEANQFTNHILFGNALGNGSDPTSLKMNPYADMIRGYKDYSRSLMLAQIEIKQNLSGLLLDGMRARLMASTNRRSYFDVSRAYVPFYYSLPDANVVNNQYALQGLNPDLGTETLSYGEGPKQVSTEAYMEFALNYDKEFGGKHNVSGLMVGILRNSINANSGSLQASLPFRNIGFSGRFSYGYDNRYQAEFNFGYNGSERFYENKRFGFFPSAGVAWNVSNESFWEGLKNVVSNLKLRATYGIIGNDAIGSATDRFFYLSEIILNDGNKGAVFGQNFDRSRPGYTVTRFDNKDISWEESKRVNFGLDAHIKEFNIVVDYSRDHRTNILMDRAFIPSTMGLSAAVRANVGAMKSEAFEASVDYNKNFKNSAWFSLRANFTYATNRYEIYEEPDYPEVYRSLVGSPTSQMRGYIAERLFVDQQDINNSPVQTFGSYMPGDIKYRDINLDGRISAADQVALGYPTSPEIVYGFGFSSGYKGFDFSTFFSGIGRTSFWIDNAATNPFVNGERALLNVYAKNHWSEENRDLYALWPRLSSTVIANNSQRSTWFMRNGALLRLKQVEFGYTLSNRIANKIFMKRMRAYVSGSNLLTFSKFKLWEPELGGNAFNYPLQRVFNLGINATF